MTAPGALANFGCFTDDEKNSILTGNALRLFPRLAQFQAVAPS